jgi:hypothetical protein
MHRLFSSGSKSRQEAPKSVFAPDAAVILSMKEMSVSTLLSTCAHETPVAKLVYWFKVHPDVSDYIYFRYFTISHSSPGPALRESALELQVVRGLDIILRQNRAINSEITAQEGAKHPFPAAAKLHRIRNLWRIILAHEAVAIDVQSQINNIGLIKLNEIRLKVCSLVSLLATKDAIPRNFIPIIKFEKLDLNHEAVICSDFQCQSLEQDVLKWQLKSIEFYRRISDIANHFEGYSRNEHVSAMTKLLSRYRGSFDAVSKCICDCDCGEFLEFISHPKCMAANYFQSYLKNGDFPRLFREVMGLYEVERDSEILLALMSDCVAPLFLPEVEQSGNLEFGDDLFEVFVECDPLKGLMCIKKICDLPEYIEGIKKVCRGLSGFSREWKRVVAYFVAFTVWDFLPMSLKLVRKQLGDYLEIECSSL